MMIIKKKNILSATFIFLTGFCITATVCVGQHSLHLTKYVNPFIGTAPITDPKVIGYTPPKGWRVWAGLTYPGAALPNGMVQLSPVTKFGSGSGYRYEDSVIVAFTHTNKGQWNLCNIPVLPATGEVNPTHFGSHYEHGSEKAAPGYYQVFLKDYHVNVELTVTKHCGFHLYHFPKGVKKEVIFDLKKANNHVKDWNITQDGTRALSGYQNTGQTIYFYATFNQNIKNIQLCFKGNDTVSVVHINPYDKSPELEMKIALSFVSIENAKENLLHEIGNQSFNAIRTKASQTWEKLLDHIQVSGGTFKEKELFYTSLYRAFLWPELRSDVNGEYRDVKGHVVKSKKFNYYTLPSLWDTYRNKLILMGMLEPHVTTDVIKSLIDRGRKTGFLPTFFFGDPACIFI